MRIVNIFTNFLFFVCCKILFAEENEVITKSVFENTGRGCLIGNIENFTTDIKSGAQFEYMYNKNFSESIYFVLNSTTGDLKTSNIPLDRESESCRFSNNCTITFGVTAKSGIYFKVVTVIVIVLDVNDNPPKFDKYISGSTELDVSEKDLAGTIYGPWSASDIDQSTINTIQTYFLEQSEEMFTLVSKMNSDGYTFSYTLILKHQLDREVMDHYQVKIVAQDGGNPVLNGTLIINVKISDANDNAPIFSQSYYEATIDENITQNTMILTVHAFDLDIGKNQELSYRIRQKQANTETINRLFNVQETSGEISVKMGLMSESAENYEFFVEAEDHGDPPLVNQTVVKITVNDINNLPSIELNLFSSVNTNFVFVQENIENGTVVAYVIVKDNDRGVNGQVTCNLNNSLYALEKVPGGGYTVVVNGFLDREATPTDNVTVMCHDNGTPQMSSTGSFEVRLADVNDNDPLFSKDVYNVNMTENNAINATVIQVRATDKDFGENGTVEYILLDDNLNMLFINNSTGVIYANRCFDREREPIVVFPVVATDHGNPRRSATATVSVILIDLNDNAPVIIPARPEYHIMENLDLNTLVGFLSAKDDDIGINAVFSFALISKNFPFSISPSGDIRTTERLDREHHFRYDILVSVFDNGTISLTSTQYVTIYIDDENDNAPKVTFPNDINNSVKCVYPTDEYNVVTTIAAYDPDSKENGSINFSIVAGNDLGIFDIDHLLGEVSVNRYRNPKGFVNFALAIQVSDMAIAPKTTTVTLNIEIQYRNATTAALIGKATGNKYVIITVAVILTTVIVAVAILGVILFLRSMDKKRTKQELCARYSDSGFSSSSELPEQDLTEEDEKTKEKKEVSLSMESNGGDFDLLKRYYDLVPDAKQLGPSLFSIQNQQHIDNHMNPQKLQYLLEAKSCVYKNGQVQQLTIEDSESETSRDTNTCDSGRGGSVCDISTPSHASDQSLSFGSLEQKGNRFTFMLKTPVNMVSHVKESIPIHHGVRPTQPAQHGVPPRLQEQHNVPLRPPIYKHPITDRRCNPYLHSRPGIKDHENKSYKGINNFQSSKQLTNIHYIKTWKDYIVHQNNSVNARMRHESEHSFRSNEDDGGSTTTSGSYILDQNDCDISESCSRQRDVVV